MEREKRLIFEMARGLKKGDHCSTDQKRKKEKEKKKQEYSPVLNARDRFSETKKQRNMMFLVR